MILIHEIIETLKGVVPALGVGLVLYLGVWFKKVQAREKRNAINEIDLSAKKISFENHTKPLNDLVTDSNKSHGADAVVKDSGDDPKDG